MRTTEVFLHTQCNSSVHVHSFLHLSEIGVLIIVSSISQFVCIIDECLLEGIFYSFPTSTFSMLNNYQMTKYEVRSVRIIYSESSGYHVWKDLDWMFYLI